MSRARSNTVMAAFLADNPETLHEATMRKSQECASRLPSRRSTRNAAAGEPSPWGELS